MTSKRDNHSNLSLFLRLLYMSATYTQIAARVVRFARLRRAKPRSARPASLFFSVGPHCVSWNQENVTQGPLAYHQWYTRYENLPGQSNNQKKKENPNLIQSSGTLSLMTLDQLLNEIEMRDLEFKEKPNPALFKTLSAFANTNGGVVCIGVSNKKEITGYRSSNADLKELSDTIGNKLAIHPVIEPVKSDAEWFANRAEWEAEEAAKSAAEAAKSAAEAAAISAKNAQEASSATLRLLMDRRAEL